MNTNQKNKAKLHIEIINPDDTVLFKFDTEELKNTGEALITLASLGETIKQCMLEGNPDKIGNASDQDKFMSLLQSNIIKLQKQIKEQMK